MQTFYYPKTYKNITIAMLDMFNQMYVEKYNTSGNVVKQKQVPIQFGNIEKMQADRLEAHYFDTTNAEYGERYYLTIPRMALKFDGISYNADRAYGVNDWMHFLGQEWETNDIQQVFKNYAPAPYDYNYTLYIKTDSMDYLAQLLENILPYFNPSVFLRVKEFSFLNIERDLKVTLNSINPELVEDMNNEDTKYSNCSLSFTVEGWMYRPWSYGSIIKVINTKYFVGSGLSATDIHDEYKTSGVLLTSAGVEYPTSSIPSSADYFTSGNINEYTKDFNWYKGYVTSGV